MSEDVPMCHNEVKSLYEALAEVQSRLTDLGLNDWREDYRGWKYDPDCECNRCELVRKFW